MYGSVEVWGMNVWKYGGMNVWECGSMGYDVEVEVWGI